MEEEVALAETQAVELLNPYAEEKLSPEHLELLFPAIFYKSDEDLSLHLSRKLAYHQHEYHHRFNNDDQSESGCTSPLSISMKVAPQTATCYQCFDSVE